MSSFRGARSALLCSACLVAAMWTLSAQNPPALAQFPPLGTGVSAEEKAALQAGVDALAVKVAALRKKPRTGQMADRVADVEVYLDAVRRPLKYGERLYAGRGSTPVAYARQTLTTGNDRADQLADGRAPWMTESGVRGFYSRIDGSAQSYILTMPLNYDRRVAGLLRRRLEAQGGVQAMIGPATVAAA